MASPTTIALPNPYTPMAFIPPELERKAMGLTYTAVGSLAVLSWDIILHLPQDYKLATRYRINIPFIIYCIARVASFAYMLGLVISLTTPLGDCNLFRQISILSPFAIPLSTLLFVMRVCALYGNNKYIVAFFSMTWLSVLSSSIVLPLIGTRSTRIGNTKYCFDTRTRLADIFSSSSILIHDTLIFVALSCVFMRISYSDVNMKNGVRVLVFGRHLPAFSKSILRDGQAYYLVVLIFTLFFTILSYMPQPPIFPCTIGIPTFVLLNTLSSYVYRNVRFGYYRDYSITTSVINDAIVQRPDQSAHNRELVFERPTSTKLEDGEGLDPGDINNGEEVKSPRNFKGDAAEV